MNSGNRTEPYSSWSPWMTRIGHFTRGRSGSRLQVANSGESQTSVHASSTHRAFAPCHFLSLSNCSGFWKWAFADFTPDGRKDLLCLFTNEVCGGRPLPLAGASEAEPVVGHDGPAELASEGCRKVSPEFHATERVVQQNERVGW